MDVHFRWRVRRLLTVGALALCVAFFAVACSDDDGDAEADIRAALDGQLAAEAAGDVNAYLPHVTDNWLKTVVGATREDVKADPSLFQSDDRPEILEVDASGSKATVRISFGEQGGRFRFQNEVDLVKQDGVWKTDGLHVISAEDIPSSAKKVKVDLKDYAFDFKPEDITSTNDLVFSVANKGDQPHMLVLVKIPAGANLQQLFASDGPPAGVEDVGAAFIFTADDKADIVLQDKLAAGRYAMLCFVADADDPEHVPHIAKGMVSDFTVR